MRKATFVALIAGLLACSPVRAQSSVLGFELASDWSSPQTALTENETYRTQGLRSLEVRLAGYTEVVSRPFSMIGVGAIGNKMWLEVRIPSPQSNPYWFGAVAMYVSAPSRGINDTYLGQAALDKCTFQGFCALEYTLPGPVADAFRTGATDVRLRIALNVAGQSSPYYLDNLRFGVEPPTPTPPAVPPADLFGFEKDGDWSSPQSNARANTSIKTEGTRSLEVRAGGYTEINSRPFSTEKITAVGTKMRFDLLLPTPQSNPYWFGALQVYLSAPSKGVNSAFVGQIALDGLPLNTFNALVVNLPQWAQDLFRTPTYDLQIKFGLNVASQTNPYVFDNIRISDDPPPPRALILVDPRLKALIASDLETYRSLAEARRGFRIAIESPVGLDDKTAPEVRAYLNGLKSANPGLEGVLLVGNVKMGVCFDAGGHGKYYSVNCAGYYEDLDATFRRDLSNAWTYDFDVVTKGSKPGIELWTAYMPVGSPEASDYASWAAGLKPYLAKVIRSYQAPPATNGRWYGVSYQIGADFNLVWDAYTPGRIELWGGHSPAPAWSAWNFSPYSTYSQFRTVYDQYQIYPGNSWEDRAAFLQQMNDPTRTPDIVHLNLGSTPTWDVQNILPSYTARTLSVVAPLLLLEGNQPAGYRLLGGSEETDCESHPFTNIAVAYLYGASRVTAVVSTSDRFWTSDGHLERRMGKLVQEYKINRKYLGAANKARLDQILTSAPAGSADIKRATAEILLGDPFLDVR